MNERQSVVLLLALFIGFVTLLVARRKIDPVAAYAGVWSVAVGGMLPGVIHYDPIPPIALQVLAGSSVALVVGYWIGGKLGAEYPINPGFAPQVWNALSKHRYLILALLLLGKSLLLLLMQARAGAFGGGESGPAVIRGTARSSLAVYIGYLSLGDLILAPIGGARIYRNKQYLQGLIPVISLFLVSFTLGGRTYIFWGATAALAGYLFSHRPATTRQALKRVAVLAVLGLLLGGVVESIRFFRSGGVPYATSLVHLLPFSDLIGQDISVFDGFVTVALFYWTSALAAFGHYVSELGQVQIHPFGWLTRGIINVYDIQQLREAVYVPVRTNVYTWLPYFYEDLGWFGFVVYPALLGAISGFAFRRLRDGGGSKFLVLSALMTTIFVFSPFDFALGNKALYLALLLTIVL